MTFEKYLANLQKAYKSFLAYMPCINQEYNITYMKTASNELKKLRSIAENSLNKSEELQKVLGEIEASLSRAKI